VVSSYQKQKNFLIISFRTPPLRESFSFPFHIVQLFVVTYVLQQQQTLTNADALKSLIGYIKKHDIPTPVDLPQNSISPGHKIKLVLLLSGSTILYMLPWQCKYHLQKNIYSLEISYSMP
jgi:hypothetical protein